MIKLWQTFINWLKRLFGLDKQAKTKLLTGRNENTPPPLEDADYEYLFMQVLEGVAHGWQTDRISRFFKVLGDRGHFDLWNSWLNRFGARLLASPNPNNELAIRMVKMGELHGGKWGDAVYDLGMKLLTRFQIDAVEIADMNPIYEFEQNYEIDEEDEEEEDEDQEDEDEEETENVTEMVTETETVSLNDLLTMIQRDANLRRQIAQQFEVESDDPEVIIESMIQKLGIPQQNEENQ